jgi:hypothetical protein
LNENSSNNNLVEKKSEVISLWWMDQKTNTRQKAGVAFYEDKYGEYRLKIDFISAMQDRPSHIYLKAVGSENNKVLYRAEALVKKNSREVARFSVGEGYSSKETYNEIFVNLGPFEKTLVLTLNCN